VDCSRLVRCLVDRFVSVRAQVLPEHGNIDSFKVGESLTERSGATPIVRTQFGSRFQAQKNGLGKPFLRGKKVVDLIGGYSNLAVLNQLVAVIEEVASA